jgi:hypothetical protein
MSEGRILVLNIINTTIYFQIIHKQELLQIKNTDIYYQQVH